MRVWVVLAGMDYEGYCIQGIFESEEDAKRLEVEILRERCCDNVKIQEDIVVTSKARNALSETQCPKCETRWTALLQSICPRCGYKLVASTQDGENKNG